MVMPVRERSNVCFRDHHESLHSRHHHALRQTSLRYLRTSCVVCIHEFDVFVRCDHSSFSLSTSSSTIWAVLVGLARRSYLEHYFDAGPTEQ